MRFDDLMAMIRRRIDDCGCFGDERFLFDDDVLSEVVELVEAAQAADPDNPSPAEAERLAAAGQLLGTLFFLRFTSVPFPRGDLTDLAHALAFHWAEDARPAHGLPRSLRALLPGPDADVISQVGAAVALFRHAMSDPDPITIRMTILLLETVVAATPTRHREYSLRMGYLVSANLVYLGMTDDLRAADEAIELSQRCLDVLSRRHPDRSWLLAAITSARMVRFQHGSLGDLGPAIDTGERALKSRERRFRARRMKRFRTGDPLLEAFADLAFSYELSPFRTSLRVVLANAYEQRYRYARGPKDLDRVIALRKRAVADLKAGNADLLAGIADAHIMRYDRTGKIRDLRRAVAAATRYLTVAGPDHPRRDYVPAYASLTSLMRKAERLGPRRVPAARPDGGWLKRLWLGSLAPLVVDEINDTGIHETEPDDAVDAVIALGERALGVPGLLFALDETVTVPNKDDPATDRTLIALSDIYAVRFMKFGDKPDIDRAVALLEQMNQLDNVGDVGKAAWVHRVRYSASHSQDDLDIAVTLYEEAFERAGDHPARGWLIQELAEVYRIMAGISGQVDFLRRAADLIEQLLADTPPDVPVRAPRAAVAGDVHLAWFRVSGDLTELNRAIDSYRQAAELGWHPSTLMQLGNAYHARFQATGELSDLRVTIDYYAQARQTDDSHRTVNTAIYCMAHRELFDAAPQQVSVDDLTTLVEVCTEPTRGEPVHKALACQAVGSLALAMNQPRIAVRVLDEAVDLLGMSVWRDTGWPEQETQLGGFQYLASESIAAHLAAGDPAGAVEVAERSRALILGSELDIRADIAGLAAVVPDLAEQLTSVRDRLTTPMVIDLVGAVHDNVGRNNRVQLWAEYDNLVSAARRLPGFANFPRPPGLAELRTAVDGGAMVLVTATGDRGDAIIVTADADPVPISLPRLTAKDVQAHAEALHDATAGPPLTRALRAPRVLTETLAWLWETTVEPILTTLPRGQRIWWLPTGTLGLLPLHAASVPGQPGALDLAVSSYIPTLRTLHHARRRARPAARRQLIVALEHTPGFPHLPGTAAEAAALHTQHPGHPLLTGTDATAAGVARALTDCTWAHFASHASTDPNASSRATLQLYGGDLSVETISRLRLDAAELAYLSACSTAARGLNTDEPVNLASAFHVAGFRHVVASLWHLADTTAAHAAQAFYQTLGDTTSADGAAAAVRTVARELRDEHPRRPDLWAALIHSGP